MPEIFILLGVPVALLLFALPSILVVWLNISSLGTQYSRGKYWLWSIILLVIMLFLSIAFSLIGNNTEGFVNSLSPNTLEFISRMGERGLSISVFVVSMLPTWIWQNVLANRIRDYGGNPWLALWGIVPLVNVFVGLYYGIAKHKASKAQEPSLAKAVYNHGKDIASEVKPAINDYKQRHQSSVNDTASVALDEDEVYEKVMLEIEEDRKVRATWGKALAHSGGDEKKATALYIQMRVEAIEQERLNKIDMQRKEEERQQRQILEDREYKALLKEEEERVFGAKNSPPDPKESKFFYINLGVATVLIISFFTLFFIAQNYEEITGIVRIIDRAALVCFILSSLYFMFKILDKFFLFTDRSKLEYMKKIADNYSDDTQEYAAPSYLDARTQYIECDSVENTSNHKEIQKIVDKSERLKTT